jgi:LEA14-like dessication related protein
MRPSLPHLILAVFASLILLSGCQSSSTIRGIAVQLVDVRATPVAGGGADLTLNISYVNENLVMIAASGARHRVTLNGVQLGRVESKEPIGLPQMGTVTQEVTLPIDPGMVARLRDMQAAGTVSYELDSTILITAGEDKMESRSSGSGTVSLANLNL